MKIHIPSQLPIITFFSAFRQSHNRQVIIVLLLSGFLGFCVGMFGNSTLQVVVQTSQVVAGIVKYPPDNPNYIGQVGTWTILHQICAIFLHAGISERTLSFLFSGILGMLSFQALALCTFAVSRRTLLAIAAPFLIYWTGAVNFGINYPIWLVGQPHTYGILGSGWMLLVIALFGAEQVRAGSLLLGLAPAIHPALGAFLWLSMAGSLLLKPRELRTMLRAMWRYVAIGFGMTLMSFLFHILVTNDAPRLPSSVTAPYLTAFIQHWDGHRKPIDWGADGVYLVLVSLFLCVAWTLLFKHDLPRGSDFLLRAFIAAAVFGGCLSTISLLPPGVVPEMVQTIMPARFLNLNILGLMALLIGLLGHYRGATWIQGILAFLMLALMMPPDVKNIVYTMTFRVRDMLLLAAALLLIGKVLLLLNAKYATSQSFSLYIVKGIIFVGMTAAIVLVGLDTYSGWTHIKRYRYEWLSNDLRDWTNDPVFARAYQSKGMLLTGADLYLIQLRTRRPVLLEGGALDSVSYAPSAGPAMEEILREIYGIDFFNPPDEAKYRAMIPVFYTKPTWEARTPAQWYGIRERFGVTDVMAYADWNLKLPEVARNEVFVLYHISEYLQR